MAHIPTEQEDVDAYPDIVRGTTRANTPIGDMLSLSDEKFNKFFSSLDDDKLLALEAMRGRYQERRQATSGGAHDSGSESLFDWLAKKSGENPLNQKERLIFWTKFGGYAKPVENKSLNALQARNVVRQVRNFIQSQTTAALMTEGYVFDGLIGKTGGGKALLYNVIELSTGIVKCAKVYDVSDETLQGEVLGSDTVHSENNNQFIVRYYPVVEFQHVTTDKPMIALVMPLFQLSLEEILQAFFDKPLPVVMVRKVAICVLSAGARFHELGMAHCDIKPGNIMSKEGDFTVIDLGAVCKLGTAPKEYTRGYYLDVDAVNATPQFDLNCSITTLARCCIPSFQVSASMTRSKLGEILEGVRESLDPYYSGLLDMCLACSSCGEALAQLNNL